MDIQHARGYRDACAKLQPEINQFQAEIKALRKKQLTQQELDKLENGWRLLSNLAETEGYESILAKLKGG